MNSFTCHAKALRRAVAFAAQPVKRRNTFPVLDMVRITASGSLVEVSGTDLDIECCATAAVIEATGKIDTIIEPKFLDGLLRWAEGEVTISREKDLITIKVDDVVAVVRELCPADDFPVMIAPVHHNATISEARLHKALTSTIDCISTNQTRYYLNGVFLHDKDGLRAVATDGRRMAIYDAGEPWPFDEMIIPRKMVAILHRAMKPGSNGTIHVKYSPDPKNGDVTLAPKQPANRVKFFGDDWTITGKTINGAFPDYTRAIPQPSQNITAVISAAALRRFHPKTRCSRAIQIDPTTGKMTYRKHDGTEVSMPVQAKGEKPVAFNIGYLKSFVNKAGTIRLETASADGPARVLTDDPALLQILMPIRINHA